MGYRKLKAEKLFDGYTFLKDHILVVNEAGVIQDVIPDTKDDDIETFPGILLPGLINCHCHLELSHMKGVIPPGTGLVPFLISVVTQRGVADPLKNEKIQAAERELYQTGTVAVADICNTADAIVVKKKSPLHWYNLVEVLNLRDANLDTALHNYEAVRQQHLDNNLTATLTPHAPYTVSPATFNELNRRTARKLISVHNSETPAENELFQKGTGPFLDLYKIFGQQQSPFASSGKSSLQTWLPYFTNGQTILLVHNIFISERDIVFAGQHATQHNLKLIYCLCPNANLYIENTLPPVDILIKHNCHIVLGTDSYSSNWQLNLMSELKTLNQKLPHLGLQTLLRWATGNARAIWGFEGLGVFERGTAPGVVLLNEGDYSTRRII